MPTYEGLRLKVLKIRRNLFADIRRKGLQNTDILIGQLHKTIQIILCTSVLVIELNQHPIPIHTLTPPFFL